MFKLFRVISAAVAVLTIPFLARPDSVILARAFPAAAGDVYSVTVSIAHPERFTNGQIRVEIRDPQGVVAAKILHPFDLDFSANIKPRANQIHVNLSPSSVNFADLVTIDVKPVKLSGAAVIAALPNSTWQQAQTVELGQTIYGTADERPYVPSSPETAYADLVAGFQWFKFTATGPEPVLAHFDLETPDRDVPPDIDVFVHSSDGAPDGIEPYREGASAYNPEATQNYPGLSPFRTRILHPGKTYYLRVAANHPEYTLRTSLYPVPPYRDPKDAVVAGMDYLIALGDAWHANTPRRGAIAMRNTMPHAEPSACIACHPTQFTVRGYLTAVENGYAIHHPAQLRFLTERLANNPRPLYGQDADWARVIFSARTVSSRVPLLLDITRRLTPEPIDAKDVERGYAEYLNLHYGDLKTLPGDEADGSLPMVSKFEIGYQSWQTYGLMARDFPEDPQWSRRRDEVRSMILAAKPENVIDLGWKITALAKMDLRADSLANTLIDELYSWQDDKGRFPYHFDRRETPADFITYQAMYALAAAGRRPETDSRLRKTVEYALAQQRTDGSWQGNPVYKGFDTPFRDTQFAVMGLSTLYHPHPVEQTAGPLRTGALDSLLADLDAGAGTADQIRTVLKQSPWPQARSAAAGRLSDLASLAALTAALGDSSKIVQRSAALSLRRIAMNRPRGVAPAVVAALGSDDGRVRWGALRIFAQEFRSLASDALLLSALEQDLARDPLAQNRFQAANALWRWYQWHPEQCGSLLDSLARQLGRESDSSVRRGLIESVYNVLDENAGQMEAWERAMASPEEQKKTDAAFHRVVAGQAAILARNLESGNRDQRIALLTALWDFHLRHMAIPDDNREKVDVILPSFLADYSSGVPRLHEPDFRYAPYEETAEFRYRALNDFHVTRLGNDADLPHLFADSGVALEQALLKCLQGADAEMTIEVIKASSVLGEAETPRFTEAMLVLLESPDPQIRAAVKYVYANHQRGRLTLGSPDDPDASLQKLLARLIDSRRPDVLEVVLPMLAELPVASAFTRDQELAWSVEKLVRDDRSPAFASVLRAAAVFPSIADSPLMRTEILRALTGADYDAAQAAVDLVLSRYITDPTTNELARQFIDAMDVRERSIFLDKLDPSKFALRLSALSAYRGSGEPAPDDDNLFSSRVVRDAVDQSLLSTEPMVRAAALDLVHSQPKLRETLHAPETAPARGRPDYDFFVAKIEPILARPGSDGKACVMCHASHAIFKLRLPGAPNAARENYANALKVIDTAEPRKSLLLIKPTRPNDAAGDANLYLATHNGGERWPGDESSPEYQTILEWIRGAKQ
ncbi:MAG TPA: hypothetical protein VK419_04165 [Bryobacteraceae bacterium]|nr:hypothetical protein [Bryobacteraceae bacterium]